MWLGDRGQDGADGSDGDGGESGLANRRGGGGRLLAKQHSSDSGSGSEMPFASGSVRNYDALSNVEDDSFAYEYIYDVRPQNQRTEKIFYFGLDEEGSISRPDQDFDGRPRWLRWTSVFCPCLVGNLLSKERREEFLKASKTFCFIVALIQVVLMFVSFKCGISPSTNYSLGPGVRELAVLGMKVTYCVAHGQEWRIFSSIFLHSGLLHLIVNVYFQLRIGIHLERIWKWSKLSAIYFLSGLMGGLLSCVVRPTYPSVGASGAMMGLLGAYLVEIILTWHRTERQKRRTSLLLCLFAIGAETALGFLPFLDISCHLGGLGLGMLLGLYCFVDEADHRFVKLVVPKLGLFLTVASFAICIAVFAALGPRDPGHGNLCSVNPSCNTTSSNPNTNTNTTTPTPPPSKSPSYSSSLLFSTSTSTSASASASVSASASASVSIAATPSTIASPSSSSSIFPNLSPELPSPSPPQRLLHRYR